MVGFFFYRQRGYRHYREPVSGGVIGIKRRSQNDRFLLRAGHVGLRVVCTEPQLLYFAVYRRLSQ